MSTWEQAIQHFLKYLPDSVSSWFVLLEYPAHQQIEKSLIPCIKLKELFVLGKAEPARLLEAGRECALNEDIGVIQFLIKDERSHYGGLDYYDGLLEFSYWPCHRVKLCLDIWDENFPLLFAENPLKLRERCYKISERLKREPLLECQHGSPLSNSLFLSCPASWTIYSGFEEFDYILPTGETACLPQDANGVIALGGWIIGTIPFGLKYGRVEHGDLVLHLKNCQVQKVTGNNSSLCADFETALLKLPGLRSVVEVGVGQSLAVKQAARNQAVGCLWHERHFGVHLGLGAELPETFDADQRVTSHHIDLVMETGVLRGSNDVLMQW